MTKISHISWGGYDKGFYGKRRNYILLKYFKAQCMEWESQISKKEEVKDQLLRNNKSSLNEDVEKDKSSFDEFVHLYEAIYKRLTTIMIKKYFAIFWKIRRFKNEFKIFMERMITL